MDLKTLLGDSYTEEIASKLKGMDIFEKGKAMPLEKFNSKMEEVNSQKKELKEQVDTLNKTLTDNNVSLEAMKKASAENPELQKQLKEYQEKINATQKEFGDTLTAKETEWQQREVNNKKSYAVREKFIMEHADKDYIDMLMTKTDLNKITINENGSFNGIDDVVLGVKTSCSKLFGVPQVKGTGTPNGGTGDGLQITKESLKTMSAEDINKNWDAVQTVLAQK